MRGRNRQLEQKKMDGKIKRRNKEREEPRAKRPRCEQLILSRGFFHSFTLEKHFDMHD